MCKPPTDQWNTNGKVTITLEKGKKKDLSSCKNKSLCFKKNVIMIPTFMIVKKTISPYCFTTVKKDFLTFNNLI